jgi:hypothetical protein
MNEYLSSAFFVAYRKTEDFERHPSDLVGS